MARRGRAGASCGVEAEGRGPQRRCAVCRKALDRDDSVRFVVGPDGAVVIDWSRKLPGRGASVCWTRHGLESAPATLRRTLGDCAMPDDASWPLAPARSEALRRARHLIGLGAATGQVRGGGTVVLGTLRGGHAAWLGLATDAGATVAEDWRRKSTGYEVELRQLPWTSEEVGAALGRDGPRSVVVARKGAVADSLLRELNRYARLL